MSNRSSILCTVVAIPFSLTTLICSLSSNDNVASPNNIRCIVSLNVVGMKLTTCHLSFAGSPRMRAFDNYSSPIPTRRAKSDMSEIYFLLIMCLVISDFLNV